MVNFYVVNTLSPCNVILGKDWLTLEKAIWPSYHLVMKFPAPHEVAEVRGDQRLSHECKRITIRCAKKKIMKEKA